MVFVDTGVWFAAFVQEDASHLRCNEALADCAGRTLTTDYVVDELVTLLSARGYSHTARERVPSLIDGTSTNLHRIAEADFLAAWNVYLRFIDKRWSFTDCTSYAVMQRLGITEALSIDDHFRQFDFATVRP